MYDDADLMLTQSMNVVLMNREDANIDDALYVEDLSDRDPYQADIIFTVSKETASTCTRSGRAAASICSTASMMRMRTAVRMSPSAAVRSSASTSTSPPRAKAPATWLLVMLLSIMATVRTA